MSLPKTMLCTLWRLIRTAMLHIRLIRLCGRTGIQIEKNKRNFRKQALHLERARAVQNIDYPCGEWRNKEGRPDKLSVVTEWRSEHPEGTESGV